MPPDWTVQRMLAWMTQDFAALGMHSPRLDAELLLSDALGCDRVRLYMDMQRPLEAGERRAIRERVIRRRRFEPVAYILGRKEFYRRWLEVTPDVLVPRPDTEILVDRALELLPAGESPALDLCTGSGAVALSLALERPELRVDATDLSAGALAVAARNATSLAVADRVQFHQGDLFAALPEPRRYALVVANPPYVAESEWPRLSRDITEHEPRLALVAGSDGLQVLRRLCAQVADFLQPGGHALFEVGHEQARTVAGLLAAQPQLSAVQAFKDFGGIERVIAARRTDA